MSPPLNDVLKVFYKHPDTSFKTSSVGWDTRMECEIMRNLLRFRLAKI